MDELRITETHRAIAEMLQESTGAHFLDSGGAYGRSWERNQLRLAAFESTGALEGVTPEDHAAAMWLEQPRAWLDQSRYGGWVTLSVFHYLSERLEYAPKLDRLFRLWCQLDGTSDRWDSDRRYYNSSATVEEFCAAMVECGMFDRDGEWAGASGYTYNEENALSQDIVWTIAHVADVFYDDENMRDRIERLGVSCADYVVGVSIHNGCDARGGFTDTRWFVISGGWDGVVDFLGWNDWSAWCTGSQEPREIPGQLTTTGEESREVRHPAGQWDCRGGYVESYNPETGDTESVKTDDAWVWDEERDIWVCAECGGAVEVDAPYIG